MHIRSATLADIPDLLEFGQRLVTESPTFAQRGFDSVKAAAHFKNLIAGPAAGVVFVVEIEGGIVGGFAGGIAEDWQSHHKLAFDYVLYVLPDCRKTGAGALLIEAFIHWAKAMGAGRIQCGTATGINAQGTVKLYESMGFELVGHFLEMEL